METNLPLIEAYVGGDDRALETLFFKRGYHEMCFLKAYSIVRDSTDARTVAHDTYMAMQGKSVGERQELFEKGGRTERSFRNYVLTVAQNKANDLMEEERRHNSRFPTEMEPDPNIPEEEPDPILDNLDRLEQCMEQLQPGDLAFVKALIEAGRQYAPLREQFGMDDGQIRATKQRILRNLRRCFGIG